MIGEYLFVTGEVIQARESLPKAKLAQDHPIQSNVIYTVNGRRRILRLLVSTR